MMKININKFFCLILCVGLMHSCSPEEADVSTVTSFNTYAMSGLPATVELQEGESMTFDFDLGDNQITDVHIVVSPGAGSTATEHDDYDFSTHDISIATLAKLGTFSLDTYSDFETEGDETLLIVLESDSPVGLETSTIEVTIKDVVSTDLVLTFDWDGIVDYAGGPLAPAGMYPICGNVDLDVYVLDASGADLGIYDAATGACPEQIVVSDWEDGEYYLASNMWDNGYAGLEANVDFPITVRAFKQDFFDNSFVPEDSWTSEDPDQANDGNAAFKEVAVVVVSGDTYVVTAPDGTIIGSGFKSPVKTAEIN